MDLFQALSGDQVCVVSPWPLLCTVAGLLASLGGSVVLGVSPGGGEKGRPTAAILLAIAMVVLASLVGLGVAVAGWAGQWLQVPLPAGVEAGPHLMRIFGGLVFWCLLLGVSATLCLGTGMVIHVLRPGRVFRPLVLVGVLSAWAMSMIGPAQVAWLSFLGSAPVLEAQLPPRVHLGRSLPVEPVLRGATHPDRWNAPSLVMEARSPGLLTQSMTASTPLVRAWRPLSIEVGEDQGDDLLPLRPGNRWVFRRIEEWRNQLLWVLPERGRSESEPLTVEVMAESDTGPLHLYRVQSTQAPASAETPEPPTEYSVYAWNGTWQIHGKEDFSFFFERTGTGPSMAGAAMVPCRFVVFAAWDCQCLVSGAGKARIPGPAVCRDDDSPHVLSTLGSIFLAVATAGLVVLDPDTDPRWVLVSSEEGGNGPLNPR